MSESLHAEPSALASSRRSLLGKAALTGLVAVPVFGALIKPAKAITVGSLSAAEKEAFKSIQSHENDHVQKIKKALGSKARPKPTFKNLSTASFDDFLAASVAFENTGVGAYLGALPVITNKDYVAFAGSIALIEARHAGFLNVLLGKEISLQAKDNKASAVDRPLTIAEVVKAVSPYVASLNGGPALTFTAGDDVSIVNFALALEYLEAEYYNINVPKYF